MDFWISASTTQARKWPSVMMALNTMRIAMNGKGRTKILGKTDIGWGGALISMMLKNLLLLRLCMVRDVGKTVVEVVRRVHGVVGVVVGQREKQRNEEVGASRRAAGKIGGRESNKTRLLMRGS